MGSVHDPECRVDIEDLGLLASPQLRKAYSGAALKSDSKKRTWPSMLKRAFVFLAVAVAAMTYSAVPAYAADKNVTQCHLVQGSEANDTYLYGCGWVSWSANSNGRHIEVGPMVTIGSSFPTQIKRCAMMLYGKFRSPSGGTWDIPQTGISCTAKLSGGSYAPTLLSSDTIADAVLMNVCVYLYSSQTGPPGSTLCAQGTWVSAYN